MDATSTDECRLDILQNLHRLAVGVAEGNYIPLGIGGSGAGNMTT